MKTIDEIRQINLAALVTEVGGTGALANLIERSQSQVSQWVTQSKHSVTGKPRVISSSSARYIEGKCNKPAGWLDKDHSDKTIAEEQIKISPPLEGTLSETAPSQQELRESRNVFSSEDTETVAIRRVKLKLSAGINRIQIDQCVEIGEPVSYTKDWLQRRGLFPEDLLALEVTGESMSPGMEPGDVVVINMAEKVPKHNKIFAVNFDGQAVIKRMIFKNKNWFLYSDNPDQEQYAPHHCKSGECIPIGLIVDLRREF